MKKYLIWFNTVDGCRDYGYATVQAETEQIALQKAICKIPNINEVKIQGLIKHEIVSF